MYCMVLHQVNWVNSRINTDTVLLLLLAMLLVVVQRAAVGLYLYFIRMNGAGGRADRQHGRVRVFDFPLEVDWQSRQVAHGVRSA